MALRGTFLGSSITSISSSVGWGTQPSELKVGLVTDLSNGDFFSPPNVGAPVYLQYGSLSFGGLLNSITRSNGPDGFLYDVMVVDPRAILEGVQLILSGYTGGVYGVPNLYNVYGALEVAYGDSGNNKSGMEWYKVKNTFLTLNQTTPIVFAGYNYYVDLTNLPSLPNYYRIGGESISLMQFILDVCDAAAHDVFFKLILVNGQNVITLFTINRSVQPQFGRISVFLNSQSNIVRSDINYELRNETTSKFLVGGNRAEVWYQFSNSGVDSNEDYTIFPYWGLDEDGDIIVGTESFGNRHTFTLPSRGVKVIGVGETYPTTVEEMRAAAAGRESWELLLQTYNNDATSPHFGKANKIGLVTDMFVSKALWDRYSVAEIEAMTPLEMSNFLGENVKKAGSALKSDHEENINKLYNYVKSYADEYYGKRYMVTVPSGIAKYDWDQNKIITSLEPTDGGFIEEVRWSGAVATNLMPRDVNFVTQEDGRIVCYAKFDNFKNLDLSELPPDSYVLGRPVGPDNQPSVFVKCTVQPELQFLDRSGVYSPRAIIELPGRVKYDFIDDEKRSDIGLFRSVMIDKIRESKSVSETVAVQIFNVIISRLGSELAFLGIEGLIAIPHMAAVPLKSNVDFYGPWYAVGAQGQTEFEKDDTLVPWNYGGYALMNLAAFSRVNDALANFQVGEGGSIEIPGIPSVDIGVQLITGGPYITDIQVNIGQAGITTVYKMSTWTPRFGKIPKSYIDTLERIQLNQQRDRRLLRELNKLPAPKSNQYRAREFYRFDTVKRKKAGTSSSVIAGEMINGSGTTKKANVIIGPAYNIVNHIEASGYDVKAINSLDTIFRPFTTDPSGTLAHYETPVTSGNGIITVNELDPYSDSDFVLYNADYPADDELIIEASGYIKGIALRGPIIITGWGYDLNDNLVPSGTDYKVRSDQWKTGPLDVRWDDDRKVWTGITQVQRGILSSTLSFEGSGTAIDSDTNVIDTVYDHLLSTGQSIASSTKVIYALIHGRKYVIGAQCS